MNAKEAYARLMPPDCDPVDSADRTDGVDV